MGFFSRLFHFGVFGICFTVNAFARLPETQSERSLLYWRYLCRGEVQQEVINASQMRELKCPKLGWAVRAPASGGPVKEIIENDSP